MLFFQAAPPIGWTLRTDLNGKVPVINSVSPTATGGNATFAAGCTVVASHTHAVSIKGNTGDESTKHDHPYWHTGTSHGQVPNSPGYDIFYPDETTPHTFPNNTGHTHPINITTTSAVNDGAAVWIPYYANCILCTKN